jgi:asparagine synthase (glutamine-hydrolysing)
MVSVWQAANVLGQPATIPSLGYTIGGIGGEIARCYYGRGELLRAGLAPAELVKNLCTALLGKRRALLTEEASRDARIILERHLIELLELCQRPEDLPDVFYTFDRVRRWGGANARKVAPIMDTIAPLAMRPFIQAAFRLPVEARMVESLHYSVIRSASKSLHELPFDKGRWPSQRLLLARVSRRFPWLLESFLQARKGRFPASGSSSLRPVRETAFRANLEAVRERCLEQPRSELWNLIDRKSFEHLTTLDGFERDGRKCLERLHNVVTVLMYAADLDARVMG